MAEIETTQNPRKQQELYLQHLAHLRCSSTRKSGWLMMFVLGHFTALTMFLATAMCFFCFVFLTGATHLVCQDGLRTRELSQSPRTILSTNAILMHPYCPDRESNPGLPRGYCYVFLLFIIFTKSFIKS